MQSKITAYLFSLLVIIFFGCSQAPTEEAHVPARYTIDQFYQNVNYVGGSFSPDESKLLVSSNATGIYNLYAIHTNGSGMDTLSRNTEESWWAVSYFPHDDRVLFSADKGGNEINHLYLLDADGTTTDLTPGENEKASFFGWSRSLKSFLYSSNKRDSRFFDIYEMDIESFESTMIFENTEGFFPSEISTSQDLTYRTIHP